MSKRQSLLLILVVFSILSFLAIDQRLVRPLGKHEDPQSGSIDCQSLGESAVEHVADIEDGSDVDPPAAPVAQRSAVEQPGRPTGNDPRGSMREGYAVRIDLDGRRHSGEDGEFLLILRHDAVSSAEPFIRGATEVACVAVKGGRWITVLPEDVSLEVSRMKLGGRLLVLPRKEWDKLGEFPTTLEGTDYPTTYLHVVDVETGVDLDEVEMIRSEMQLEDHGHPGGWLDGSPRSVVRGLSSPIEMRLGDNWPSLGPHRVGYWIKARDHAWHHATVDHEIGGTYTVELPLAGTLEVKISDWPAGAPARLRLHVGQEPESAFYCNANLNAPGVTQIADLVVGPYQAVIDCPSGEAMLATNPEERITILPGRTTFTTVSCAGLDLSDAGTAIPLGGEIIARGRPLPRELSLEISSAATRKDKLNWCHVIPLSLCDNLRYTWATAVPRPGSYALRILPIQTTSVVEVGPGGNKDVTIVLPQLAEVSVCFMEGDTQEPAAVKSMAWRPLEPDGVPKGAFNVVTVSIDRPGCARFVAPLGRVEVACDFSEEYATERRDFAVVAGLNEQTIVLMKSCGFRLSLLRGQARLPWQGQSAIFVVDDRGSMDGVMITKGLVKVPRPGNYTVHIEKISGFEAIDDFEVSVTPGTMQRVDVPIHEEVSDG